MLTAQIAFVSEVPYYEERRVNAQRLLNSQIRECPRQVHYRSSRVRVSQQLLGFQPLHVQASAEELYPEPDDLRVQSAAPRAFLVIFSDVIIQSRLKHGSATHTAFLQG